MKKILLLTLAATLMTGGLLVAGCKDRTGDKPADKTGSEYLVDLSKSVAKKTAITVWMDDSEGNYFAKLKEEFKKVQPNILLRTQNVGNVESIDQLQIKGPSGNGADVIQFPHDKLSGIVSQDLALPLDGDLVKLAEERVIPSALKTTRFIDPTDKVLKTFAVPKEVEAVGLYYNKSLIKKEEIPTTFEDIVKKAPEFAQKNQGAHYFTLGGDYTNAYMLEPFMSPFGFRPFGENGDDAKNIGFAKEGFKKGLEYLRTLVTPLNMGGEGKGYSEEFTSGKSPLSLQGPWMHSAFKKANIDYGRVVTPTLNGVKMNPFAGAQLVSIYKYTRHQNEAKKFLEFLLGDNAAIINYETKGKAPALKQEILNTIPVFADDEVLSAMAKDLETAILMPSIPQIEQFWGPAATAYTKAVTTSTLIEEIAKEAEDSYIQSAKIKVE